MNKLFEKIEKPKELLPIDLQGWNSQHHIFYDMVKELLPKTIIEVGTWKGASAIRMAESCRSFMLDTKIYCIDTWLGAEEFWTRFADTKERDLMQRNGYPQIYYQFLSNVFHKGYENVIQPIPATSFIGAKIFEHYGIKADLIYIDGSHDYDDVKADIKAYKELLNPNGIMFGDDYGWPSVSDAVKESFSYTEIEIIDQNFWVWKKN